MKMIVQKKVTETQGFLAPAAADKGSCITWRYGAYCTVEGKAHIGHGFKRAWMIVRVTTRIPSILDHWVENFGTELVMSKRHEANDVVSFTHVDV